jgi:glutamyl-tRNA synthetase
MRLLSIEDLTHRVLPFLKKDGVVSDPISSADAALLELAMPLVAERINNLAEASELLAFLFVSDEEFSRTDEIDEAGLAVVRAAHDALADLHPGSTAAIEEALRHQLIEELGLKPRVAFGPVRIAVSGKKISPPLFESMELLGRDRSLARLQSALA